MDKKQIIVFLSTFIMFSIEAILHYNIGKNGMTSLVMPSLVDIVKLAVVVGIFSLLSTILSSFIQNQLDHD